MYDIKKKPAVLLLEDGTSFFGVSIGKQGTSGGEICFNTGLTGYQEIYTDPSYYGQIIVNTTSHIGNYGVVSDETESSSVKIKGLVVKTFSEIYSRKTADSSLQDYLDNAGVVGIAEIDTRKLVRHIREKGAMNAIISSEILDLENLKEELDKIPSMDGLELSSKVTTSKVVEQISDNEEFKVAVLDLGIKTNILRNFKQRNCSYRVYPANTPFEEMQKWQPDGYFISNGPGDPASTAYAVETVKQILDQNIPLFGICMGHQMLGLAAGISTYKMHHGHRGLNHPVKNLLTGKCEITSQNHGFSVSAEDIAKSENVEATHINLNDDTVEGIRIKNKNAFSVQYHPESSPGPHDSRYLFDDFIEMIKLSKNSIPA
ncbi:glutamine-hydrolyzing carbamoyl-phosphate synthase small subunit [Chondrinema litorale]|uniref:glutamine-hydrolyzing carbamoyl-phosphate synthase small subunit n=1 Tax=Chondrinema litorale TaxID=2994555 RepID=UPI0025443302|nr:glutamine-hydrolyzing carbamoyl-phosphate synthase small subunit [Chondrinema litorale]UZR92398.1 glutamine-hydrolyzing carbamoyl-phosphate synthase small subunit [Chondrinema litorale]